MNHVHRIWVRGPNLVGGHISQEHDICIECYDWFLGHTVINGFTVSELSVKEGLCDSCDRDDVDLYYGSGQ